MRSDFPRSPLGSPTARDLPPTEIVEAFARHVPGAIYVYRRFPDGRATLDYISDGIVDIYGYTPDELYADVELGHARIHAEDRPAFEASVARCFDTHAPWRCEYRVVLPAQGVRHISAAATLEPQDDGSVIWIGHLIDVTEFARARTTPRLRPAKRNRPSSRMSAMSSARRCTAFSGWRSSSPPTTPHRRTSGARRSRSTVRAPIWYV